MFQAWEACVLPLYESRRYVSGSRSNYQLGKAYSITRNSRPCGKAQAYHRVELYLFCEARPTQTPLP